MIRERSTLSSAGSWALGAVLAAGMFGVAVVDLMLPSASYPSVGGKAPITYRVPGVQVLQVLDEKSELQAARFEIPRGQVLGADDLSKLRGLEDGRRPVGLGLGLGLGLLLLGLFVGASFVLKLMVPGGQLLRVQLAFFLPLLILLAAAKAAFVFTSVAVFAVPLLALTMVWGMLRSRRAAVLLGGVGALAAGTLYPLDLGLMLTLAAQAMVPPALMGQRRKRRSPALVWVGGALASIAVYAAFHFASLGGLPKADLADVQRSGLLALLGAAACSPLLAYALKPLYERALGIVSRGRLLELADLDHPLLKELATEAPGTWQHTLAMANMAEVVSNAIGADGNLARVGAYYHDVGKTLEPVNFAENLEAGERSPHADYAPEESADVIFDHVVGGVELAEEHGIPSAVQEFMYTHHGDGRLEFFWHKCQEQGNPEGYSEDDFRYPGVRPQTRETAILAIVDAAEAASRTLKDPQASDIDTLIQALVFGKLKGGQLDQAGLTAGDLATIINTLRDILRAQFHVRPEYPWQKQERERQERENSRAHLAVPEEDGSSPPVTAPVAPSALLAERAARATTGPVEPAPTPEPQAEALATDSPARDVDRS